MAVPDLIFLQKQQTQKTAMNVPTMLADFLDLVTPKFLNKHLQKSLSASLESLLTNGQCSVTAGIESDAQEKHCIKRADRLLSHTTMQQTVPLFYAAMTGAIVKGKQPLILVDWSNADKERRHFILVNCILFTTQLQNKLTSRCKSIGPLVAANLPLEPKLYPVRSLKCQNLKVGITTSELHFVPIAEIH